MAKESIRRRYWNYVLTAISKNIFHGLAMRPRGSSKTMRTFLVVNGSELSLCFAMDCLDCLPAQLLTPRMPLLPSRRIAIALGFSRKLQSPNPKWEEMTTTYTVMTQRVPTRRYSSMSGRDLEGTNRFQPLGDSLLFLSFQVWFSKNHIIVVNVPPETQQPNGQHVCTTFGSDQDLCPSGHEVTRAKTPRGHPRVLPLVFVTCKQVRDRGHKQEHGTVTVKVPATAWRNSSASISS